MAVRGTNVCLRKIDYPTIWRLLKEEGVTHFNAAPTVNTLLCADSNAARLKQPCRVTVAASPPTGHLFEQMTNLNLRPVHVYGLTETYGPITKGYILPEWDTLEPKEKFALMARQGHGFVTGLPVRVIKMDQPEGVLVDVAKDGKEIGEIVMFGNICAKGYYKDPEATRKLFAGGGLHSGDLAVWHPDGSVQILDRAKDIIISGKCGSIVLLPVPIKVHRPMLHHVALTSRTVHRRREYILSGIREYACKASGYSRGGRCSRGRLSLGRAAQGLRDGQAREAGDRQGHRRLGQAPEPDLQVYGATGGRGYPGATQDVDG